MLKARLYGIFEKSSVRAISLFTALAGVLNVLSSLTPPAGKHFEKIKLFAELEIRHGGRLSIAITGFFLLVFAGSLWRRKKSAWLLAIIAISVSIFIHIYKDIFNAGLVLSCFLLLWMVYIRSSFHAKSDMPSIGQGIKVFLFALIFTIAYGVCGFYLLDRHFNMHFDFINAVKETFILFTEFYSPQLLPATHFERYFSQSISIVGIITIGYALLMLVRPVLIRKPSTAEERNRAKKIIETYGKSSLARVALLEDKSYYFSPGGSVLAFVQKGRVSLCLGDPIGPEEDILPCISSFAEHCSKFDWLASFYQVKEDYLQYYKRCGFDWLCIGQEGTVETASFSLSGKSGGSLRTSINRFTKAGYKVQVHEPPISARLLQEFKEISDEWLTMVHGQEQRFSLGWFYDEYVRECFILAVHAPDGTISAFANIIPEYLLSEITIDLMRHRKTAEAGTMDVLFVSLIQWAKENGYAGFSMGLSPLAGVGKEPRDKVVERAFHYIYENINQFYNFKGLHEFKSKFKPVWFERYLIYPGIANLPNAITALVRANTGNGFLYYIKEIYSQAHKKMIEPYEKITN